MSTRPAPTKCPSARCLPDETVPCDHTQWRHPVLVLINIDYEPFTPRARPGGRVIYLRPAPEHDYLASPAEAGEARHPVAGGD